MLSGRLLCRRGILRHGSKRRLLHTENVQDSLRQLLRQSAQPVVVITSLLSHKKSLYHGATLSSFTSVAMHPHPLVAFSLRTPSRMATSIHDFFDNSPKTSSPHIVINVLSSEQADTAVRFSRPDLHPTPFDGIEWHPSEEGIPILRNCVGTISCQVVASSRLDGFIHGQEAGDGLPETTQSGAGQIVSELFLARVLRVERDKHNSPMGVPRLPLIYHDRLYTTIAPNE